MLSMYDRSVSLTGCGNFRDLGGYATRDGGTVRWRRLFRSDALHQLTTDDIATLGSMDVRIAVSLDLRSPGELAATGPGLACDRGARHVHVPMIREVVQRDITGVTAAEHYMQRLVEGRDCVAGVFRTLAENDAYPAVFYCAAGKDRTGIVAAVLLRALGVADDDIIADYALTKPMALERRAARMRELGWTNEVPLDPSLAEARPETMKAFLHGMDEQFGSVENYLASCAIDRATVDKVRAQLVAQRAPGRRPAQPLELDNER